MEGFGGEGYVFGYLDIDLRTRISAKSRMWDFFRELTEELKRWKMIRVNERIDTSQDDIFKEVGKGRGSVASFLFIYSRGCFFPLGVALFLLV